MPRLTSYPLEWATIVGSRLGHPGPTTDEDLKEFLDGRNK
jgi:hypothetical protein